MTLFTKSLCSACQEVKQQFDLETLGITLEELGPDNPRALAQLAWHELVETVETKAMRFSIAILSSSLQILFTEKNNFSIKRISIFNQKVQPTDDIMIIILYCYICHNLHRCD